MSTNPLQHAQSSAAMSLLRSNANSDLVNAAANSGHAAQQAASHELARIKGSEKAAATAKHLKYELAAQAKNRSSNVQTEEAYYLTLSEEALEQYSQSEKE